MINAIQEALEERKTFWRAIGLLQTHIRARRVRDTVLHLPPPLPLQCSLRMRGSTGPPLCAAH